MKKKTAVKRAGSGRKSIARRTSPTQQRAEDALELLLRAIKKRRGIGAWEVYLEEERRLAIESKDGEVESLISARVMGAAVRAVVRGRVGFSYTNEFTAREAKEAVERAVAAAALMPAGSGSGFTAPPAGGWPALEIVDRSLDKVPVSEKVDRARLIESSARDHDRRVKTVRGAEYEESHGEVWVFNSEGVEARAASTLVAASVEVTAEDRSGAQAASELETAHYCDKLDVARVGRKAAEQAVGLLGARPVSAGKYPVVLSGGAACGLVSVLAPAACGDAVAKHRSWLGNKLGKKIAGPVVTIVDDALLAEGPGAFPFDDEGTASRTVMVVRAGVLENFLYDAYYGRMAGTGSTGNGVRQTYFVPPAVDITNWVLLPGRESESGLVAQVEDGIMVVELMGLHTADAVAGEFSMGALGYRIRKGSKDGPVTGITISGTLHETLLKIEAVADRVKFSGDSGSPALLIAEMDVSGPGTGREA